jgi:hypothetical protein
MYGGPEMAAMFRQMAEVALGVAAQKNRGSFFKDFETFTLVKVVWQQIIRRQMPRPGEELLAEVCREWDALKSGSLQTATQRAAREWLIDHTPVAMTLVQMLAGLHEPSIGGSAGPRQPAADKPSSHDAAATRETAMPTAPIFFGSMFPPIDALGKAPESLTSSEGVASTAFSGSADWPIGSIARAMEGLLPAQGSVRAAASEVSRLAELLADATQESAPNETAVPPTTPDPNVVAGRP